MVRKSTGPVEILLVEDNPADVQLINLMLKQTKLPHRMTSVGDGEAATRYLFEKVKKGDAPCPELIILDLNLPGKSGKQVLNELKSASETRGIPILIFTTSRDEEDVRRCYELHANCYVSKPTDLARFNTVLKTIEEFWFGIAELPKQRVVTKSA